MKHIDWEFYSRRLSGGVCLSDRWSEFALGAHLHFDLGTNTIVVGHEVEEHPPYYRVWMGVSLNLLWARVSLHLHV
jgi:hypothetical protein